MFGNVIIEISLSLPLDIRVKSSPKLARIPAIQIWVSLNGYACKIIISINMKTFFLHLTSIVDFRFRDVSALPGRGWDRFSFTVSIQAVFYKKLSLKMA